MNNITKEKLPGTIYPKLIISNPACNPKLRANLTHRVKEKEKKNNNGVILFGSLKNKPPHLKFQIAATMDLNSSLRGDSQLDFSLNSSLDPAGDQKRRR